MNFNVTPISAAQIKNIQIKANEVTFRPKTTSQIPTDKIDLSNKKQETNWMKIAAWGAGILVAAGAAYYFIRKGKVKTSDIKETASTAAENIRKFFDKDNKLVEGIKFDKGKALAADGTGFTGVFKTTDKAGRNIAISYENGVMTSSKINDKLFKSYSQFKEKNGNFGITICEHLSDGTKQLTQHRFHDNGKIKYVIKAPKGADDCRFGTLVGYSKSGKKILEAQNDPHNQNVFAKFFDENGNMYKHRHAVYKFKNGSAPEFIREDIIENGNVVIRKTCHGCSSDVFLAKIINDTPIEYNCVVKNGVQYTPLGNGKNHGVFGKFGKEQYNCSFEVRHDPVIEIRHVPREGGGFSTASIDLTTGKIDSQDLPKDKNFLQDFFAKIEDMIKVAKEENMNVILVDKNTKGFDIPKGVQMLKEHFLK